MLICCTFLPIFFQSKHSFFLCKLKLSTQFDIRDTRRKVSILLLTGALRSPGRKSLCLRSSRWNSPETTVIWPRAATLTALRSSQPPWSTTSGRRTPVRTTVPPWPPLEWAWRWLRAGRRPSDRPWCPSPLSPAWPAQQLRAKITVSPSRSLTLRVKIWIVFDVAHFPCRSISYLKYFAAIQDHNFIWSYFWNVYAL